MATPSTATPGAETHGSPMSMEAATANDEMGVETTEAQENRVVPLSSIYYVQESYKATAVPVTITMILSALAANFIRTEESAKEREEALTSSYSAIEVSDDASSPEKLGIGLVNGLVIIAAITAMTFAVVILYKYKCMCFLKGYLVLSITFLLGYFGAVFFNEAIKRYELWVSKISFALLLYNFTVVGVYALFFGQGVPVYVGQGYLIAISVILAWELSHFSEVTAWVLLVLLALYDLFAVLTPCGPLKALVNLMGKEGAQQIPALLYEAQLPPQARRQPTNTQQRQTRTRADARSTAAAAQPNTISHTHPRTTEGEASENNTQASVSSQDHDSDGLHGQTQPAQPTGHLEDEIHQEQLANDQTMESESSSERASQSPREMVIIGPREDEFETASRPTGTIPLAIAKLYKLPLVDGTAEADHSVDELKSFVQVYYPRNGGRMVQLPTPAPAERGRPRFRFRLGNRADPDPEPTKYNVVDRHNVVKRTIFVGDDGKVYRVLDEVEQEEQERTTPSSVKLGLGDFIFYSVLVSKASLHSFPTFAACVVGILAGLLLTLFFLAIRGKALPALPISIFFGVLFYVTCRYGLEPWIHNVFWAEFYV